MWIPKGQRVAKSVLKFEQVFDHSKSRLILERKSREL